MKSKSVSRFILYGALVTSGASISTHVYAQLRIPQQILEPVTPVIERIPAEVDTIRDVLETTVNQGVEGTLNTLSSIPAPQFSVPSPLSLNASSGNLILKEVETPDGFLAVEREWLFVGNEADINYFAHPDITIKSSHYLPAIDQWIYRLKVTTSLDELSQIGNSLPEALKAQVGRNHIYLAQGVEGENKESGKAKSTNPDLNGNTNSATGQNLGEGTGLGSNVDSGEAISNTKNKQVCQVPVRIGMVDTEVAQNHPRLEHVNIEQQSFLPQNLPATQVHGTSVASLLANNMHSGSQLYNASVFYTRNSVSQGATLLSLIDGLNYLLANHVDVINMSLAGPENPVLAKIIEKVSEQGVQIIAAVGNEGPASPPLYPAAYPSTIAVTAVDANLAIYRWANQGSHVDFAAQGVSVETAHPDGTLTRETGTSMATPLISARYACLFRATKNQEQTIVALRDQAIDAGAPGRDSVFGVGIL
ncbi:S8 family serine peptidase [Alteromonas sp. 1_MG-2023]|uniref:S8 family serine peptidase n=1 Tax=Alteromonas sp. 1_MG-2023 TaxID=3062669 RepID=UPI0026E13996|nr:S8 family serine peptidase [Alteromonas sp. 1_MG-2023]MDO6567011.1 S8 family serine peptidase [Alteromonas sp. 1_MG-2023]